MDDDGEGARTVYEFWAEAGKANILDQHQQADNVDDNESGWKDYVCDLMGVNTHDSQRN